MARKSSAQAPSSSSSSTLPMEPLIREEDEVVFLEEEEAAATAGGGNDLSHWEFINPSDADDSDTDSLLSLENGFVCWQCLTPLSPPISPEIPDPETIVAVPETLDIHESQHFAVHPVNSLVDQHHDAVYDLYRPGPLLFPRVGHRYYSGDQYYDYDYDDEDADGYGFGPEDELAPWHLSEKLGKQRMRKLGKKGFAKVSKRNHHRHGKPGGVFGKHGLGMKA